MPIDTPFMTAYCGPAPTPADLLARWNFDPWLLAALGLAGVGWIVTAAERHGIVQRRAFVAAIAVLAVAFVSPLCAASVALFSARAVHHVLLVALAAPLLALAGVLGPREGRTPYPLTGGPLNPAGLPLLVATGVLFAWHLPPLYAAALQSTAVYWAMQASLLVSATWFWAAALSPRASPPAALLAMVGAAALMGLLGALLTFAPRPLYAAHAVAPYVFGLTPLADQQLAGLVMWVPALVPYFVFAAVAARRASRAWARSDA